MTKPVKITRRAASLMIEEDLLFQAKVRCLEDKILLRDLVEQAIREFLAKS
jgi:hypothetical protein